MAGFGCELRRPSCREGAVYLPSRRKRTVWVGDGEVLHLEKQSFLLACQIQAERAGSRWISDIHVPWLMGRMDKNGEH